MFAQLIFSTRVQMVTFITVLVIGFISFLSITPVASAQTSPSTNVSELQAMIERLMVQIALLQGGTPTTPLPPTVSLNRFVVGESVDVAAAVRVRSNASLVGAVLGTQTAGQRGTVVDGPIRADGHIWWKIDYLSGPDGWTAEFWLVSNSSDGQSAMQKGFHRVSRGAETAVSVGKQDARFAKVEIPAANLDRYVNKVTMFASAGVSNAQKQPWLAFKTVSIFKNGIKIGSKDVSSQSAWRSVRTSDTVESVSAYEVILFEGNVKILAGVTYTADLAISLNTSAGAGDTWSFGIPEQGVVVWSNITGPVKYGHQVERVVLAINKSTSTVALGNYVGYMNGEQFIGTNGISKAEALSNCKLQATNNPTAVVRCTWNDIEIYSTTTVALGDYVGYMNEVQFIGTNGITRAEALSNCKKNAGDNPTASVRCTWNGVEIYSSTPVVTAPGKNSFGCDRTLADGSTVADGKVACYGMWDYGDAFGGDKDMCGAYSSPKKGCEIKTTLCNSGSAKATTYYTGTTIPAAKINTVSANLQSTGDVVKKEVAGLWEYTCITPVTTAPGKNNFACDRSVLSPLGNGKLACYGMWDYGDAFGGDKDMCGAYGSAEKGCVISTPVCESGSAKATVYYTGTTIPSAKLSAVATRLKTTSDIASKEIAGIWEYTCVAPTPVPTPIPVSNATNAGAVLGASTDIYSEISTTLKGISEFLQRLR